VLAAFQQSEVRLPSSALYDKGSLSKLWPFTQWIHLVYMWINAQTARLLGFIGHIGGSLIHILLVIAVIVLIFNLVSGRRGI